MTTSIVFGVLALASAAGGNLDGNWQMVESASVDVPPIDTAHPATLPGNWFLSGDTGSGVRWYLREVSVSDPGARNTLVFDGVDYAALVFWDGVKIGEHRGYFDHFRVEVPRGGGVHQLAVRVDSPEEAAGDFSLRKKLIKGVLSHHDTRPGGAWSKRGQENNTGGIWGSVNLEQVWCGWVDTLRVDTLELTERNASLEVVASLQGVVRLREIEVRVTDPRGTLVFSEREPWSGALEWRHAIKLAHPRWWWPAELGESPLYTVEVALIGVSGTSRFARRFGVRTVSEDAGRRFIINGRPFFLRGTNYIPSTYLAEVTPELVRADLALMRAAHINAIRVHAHITAPAFYDLADELGLVVFQDFPLQWGYDDSQAFVQEASRQAARMLATLGSHPSIIHWTGHNEAPWSADWMIYKYPDWKADQNRVLDAALERVLRTDRTRPSQANSHTSEHAWAGWYFGTEKEFDKPSPQPLLTEFGAQALPELATMKEIFPLDEPLWPIEGARLANWEHHNFQPKETFETAHVPRGDSIEALITNTQSYQARLIQYATEALRRQQWQPVTGVFQFMFNEHWPSMNWGVVDYRRRPKPGYQALATAYQPLLGMARRRPGTLFLELSIVNDGAAHADAEVRVATGEAGELPRGQRLQIPANGVVRLAGVVPRPTATQALSIEIYDASGLLLSTNTYRPGYFEHE
jgi:beta-mannosidase